MTSVLARWYPVAVRLPGEVRARGKRYAVLARGERDGLFVWSRPRDEPDVHLAVDWAATPRLPSDRQARNGVSVVLVSGETVVLTVGGACRCGALGRWAGPPWAHSVRLTA